MTHVEPYYMHGTVTLLQVMQLSSLAGNLNMYSLSYDLNQCSWVLDIPRVTSIWLFHLIIVYVTHLDSILLTDTVDTLYDLFTCGPR